ncbi:hypothetical protein GWI34_15395 [Actinomadura sp. DSM 109109]|nr:hypothetical protein [Actinomadura lepetitiana]
MVGLDLLSREDTPMQVFGDTTYSAGQARHAFTAAGHRLFIKPAPPFPAA